MQNKSLYRCNTNIEAKSSIFKYNTQGNFQIHIYAFSIHKQYLYRTLQIYDHTLFSIKNTISVHNVIRNVFEFFLLEMCKVFILWIY